jgi:signal transduction histidine kinase
MSTQTPAADGHSTGITYDNQLMTESARPELRHVLQAPFTRRAWSELGHTLASIPLALAAVAFIVPMLANGALWALSTDAVRKFGDAARFLTGRLLGEEIPAPPPVQPEHRMKVATPDAIRLCAAVSKAGGKSRVWETKPGVTTKRLTQERITELAAEAGVTITSLRAQGEGAEWFAARILDPVAWRARAYFALKLPLAAAGLAVIAACWLGGGFCLAFPVWWAFAPAFRVVPFGLAFSVFPVSATTLLVSGAWLLHGVTEADRWLMRGLLGPVSPAERIRALEQSRARAVDDSAARLRGIERDLHDGTQAQLVALAMKLGLAMEKLQDNALADLPRVTQLVGDAHRGALEAITDLRTLARGIHPPVLDNGLADALATLVNHSALPVELVTEIPERPSAAIETIAYFSAAELLANVAKHSCARHATLEAVHVPGLLRIRVTDDGHGGARPVPGGGLRGLAERVRTVDGRIEINSPQGGPTTVVVELPSRA